MISIGDRLDGKYVIVRRLGDGGYGEVFLADDEAIPDRRVAIKVLVQHSAGDHSDLIWEMQTLARFNHAGVVGFYHHFSNEDHLCLVMEYCAGGSMDDLLASGGKYKEPDVMKWGLDLCKTLAFVHQKDIVHHDVKPANVLFAADGRVKLGDFGVANRNTGTRMYLAPEMLLGEQVSRTDPRVDIYALGLTMLEALTGIHPFEHLNREEALQARIAHNFVPDTLPHWVQDVLLKATHPTPELRFQTMRDFGEAILGKRVLYVFNKNRIQAHRLAEKAEVQIARKRWNAAEKLVARALHLSPDCVAALLAAGRCQLLIRRIDQAKEYFSKAVSISPRTPVQKELGWLNLEEGRLPTAISLLTDHLQRNSSDYEAYNLLLKCFFFSDRFEVGMDLAGTLMDEKAPNDCFRNNRFLCRLLDGRYAASELEEIDTQVIKNPFSKYNFAVLRERPRSWEDKGPAFLKSKLIFQEYRFGIQHRSVQQNTVAVHMPDGNRREMPGSIMSIGSLPSNDIVIDHSSVSRRHAVIINFRNDVWIHDLGSTCGTEVNSKRLVGRTFLDGVHDVKVGRVALRVEAAVGLLV
jgi:serine/threonine protein kinase